MQKNMKTTPGQASRPASAPAPRASSSQPRTANPQTGNRPVNQSGRTVNSAAPQAAPVKKKAVKKKPKDRLGTAITSMILSSISIFILIGATSRAMDELDYRDSVSPGVLMLLVLAFILAFIGFINGITASRSPRGKGMAITGIVLSIPPILVPIVIVVATFALNGLLH